MNATDNKTGHTSLPWEAGREAIADDIIISKERYSPPIAIVPISNPNAVKDAALIRESCNNYERVKEALEKALPAMQRMDAMLLKLTNSPYECEKMEIQLAREVLESLKPS